MTSAGFTVSSRSARYCRLHRQPNFNHQAKRADPNLLSDRAKRDALLLPDIKRVHKAHFEVYGMQKVWRQLGREGFSVARCNVARLMRANGIEGAEMAQHAELTILTG
jgi:putative transposase